MDVQYTTESTNSSKLQDSVDTRLHGRWLLLARVVWFIMVALALLVFIFSMPVYITQLQSVCNGNVCANGQLTPQSLKTLRNLMLSMDSYVTIRIAITFVSA